MGLATQATLSLPGINARASRTKNEDFIRPDSLLLVKGNYSAILSVCSNLACRHCLSRRNRVRKTTRPE